MIKHFLTLALIGLFFITQALAGTPVSPIEGYEVVPIKWNVQATPGGSNITVHGTVQDVVAKFNTVNPNWKRDLDFENTVKEATNKLEKRGTWLNPAKPCTTRWEYCNMNDIDQGVTYLQGVKGHPGAGPGPGQCGRVSCQWGGAIWWCNDNHKAITLDSFSQIADGALKIFWGCEALINGRWKTKGQIFNSDGWNVIVRWDATGGCSK